MARLPRVSPSVALTRAASVVCGLAGAALLVIDVPRPAIVPLVLVVLASLGAAWRPEPRALPVLLAAHGFCWIASPHPAASPLPPVAAALVLAQMVLLVAGTTAPPSAPLDRRALARWARRWAILTLTAALTWGAAPLLADLPSPPPPIRVLLAAVALLGVGAVTYVVLVPGRTRHDDP